MVNTLTDKPFVLDESLFDETPVKLNESVFIPITRMTADFDKACDEAYASAAECFGVDDDERYMISVDFLQYSRVGASHFYSFNAIARIVEK